MSIANRINFLARRYGFTRYLEIGVCEGATFLRVGMPHKTAVDPKFRFDTHAYMSPLTSYFETTSDDFFASFPQMLKEKPFNYRPDERFLFDIVYIDGLHVFPQPFIDFENVMEYIHDNTIIIMDDTLPSDPYSAIPDEEKSIRYRKLAGFNDTSWHGDVYKTIFAIHDKYPDWSYATSIYPENPQTILWKTKKASNRTPIFNGDIEKISALSYFDLLDYAHVLVPVQENVALEMVGMDINPEEYKSMVQLPLIARKLPIA